MLPKMVRNAYTITRKEAAEIFLILSQARLKLTGKIQTSAQKYWEKFEEALNLRVDKEYAIKTNKVHHKAP